MPNLLGTAPNQVPTNADLGKLAFMDVVDTVTNNPYLDTAISDTKPSLLLDFANSKTLDPRITYTRASTASYYDGKTTAVAEQNLLTYSQEFDNAAWSNTLSNRVANSTTAPDGTSTADSFTASASTGEHRLFQSVASSGQVTFSVFVKKNTHDFVQFRTDVTGSGYVNFDINLGSLSATTATGLITSVGNGWYRCSATFAGATIANVQIELVSSVSAARAESWTTAGTESIYLWGAQLEQRSAVSSYTPTTASPITNYIPALQTAAAGVPRFDHDPVTRESKGFLIEEQRTNLLTYSDQFDNAAWSKARSSITANAVVGPDGTLSADKFIEDTTASLSHYVSQTYAGFTSGTSYTYTVYAKAGERSQLYMLLPSAAFTNVTSAYFDLSNGTAWVVGNAPDISITPVGNGWYRCSMSKAATATVSGTVQLYIATSGTFSYTGDGYSGLYIWGAQLEAGSFATSYIPTTSAQVTRSADAASITGANFSSWYRADEGTLYSESQTQTTTGNGFAVQISDNSYNNRIVLGQNSSGSYGSVVVANTVTLAPTGNPSRTMSLIKQSFSFKLNDCQLLTNSTASIADTSGQMVSGVTQINIGSDHSNANGINGTIKKLAYYPKRLSDAELQEMTL